jgi:excisionase family DNA binding protein
MNIVLHLELGEMSRMERRAYNPEEVAEQLGVSRQAILAAMKRGEINPMKVSELWRVSPSEIEWILGGQ